MKIAELLSVASTPAVHTTSLDATHEQTSPVLSASASPPTRKLDMASLDRFTQAHLQHDAPRTRVHDLSLNRIIQELHADEQPAAATQRTASNASQQQQQLTQLAHYATAVRKQHDTADAADLKASTESTRLLSVNANKRVETDGDAAVDASASTRRRRTRNGFAPLTESEKRVKQRQLVKRSYYRKIDTLNELRDEAERLEDTFHAVLDGRRRHAKQHALALSPYEVLRDKYTALAIAKHDLRHENEALRAAAADQSKARTRVGILLDEELREQSEVATAVGLDAMRSDGTSPDLTSPESTSPLTPITESEPIVQIRPMTTAACMDVVKRAYTRVMAFRATQNLVTTGASVFGWRDRRKIEHDSMQFCLEKTFSRTAQDVATTMWRVLSTETGVNRIYNAAGIAIRFYNVQQVDANNVVFYRTIEREGTDVVIKALVLASLVEIDTGYLLLFHSLDPADRLVTTTPSDGLTTTTPSAFVRTKREFWGDVFSWGLYERAGECDELCCNSFGGFVPSTSATSVEFWLMHILLIAVRCETEAIGSLFMLQ